MQAHSPLKKVIISLGARVILACRDTAKGEQAAREIMREVNGAEVVARQLDLADTKSICQFAENIYNSGWRTHRNLNSTTVKYTFYYNAGDKYSVLQLRRLFTT